MVSAFGLTKTLEYQPDRNVSLKNAPVVTVSSQEVLIFAHVLRELPQLVFLMDNKSKVGNLQMLLKPRL